MICNANTITYIIYCKTNTHTKYIHNKIVLWFLKLKIETIYLSFLGIRYNVRTYCVMKNVETILI